MKLHTPGLVASLKNTIKKVDQPTRSRSSFPCCCLGSRSRIHDRESLQFSKHSKLLPISTVLNSCWAFLFALFCKRFFQAFVVASFILNLFLLHPLLRCSASQCSTCLSHSSTVILQLSTAPHCSTLLKVPPRYF